MARRVSARIVVRILAASVATAVVVCAQTREAVTPQARSWIGRADAIEAYLKVAEVERFKDTSAGVTRPRRGFLTPGGPVTELLWKPLTPGIYRGFHESYKSEVAAYELSKLVALDMVPPVVERTIDGVTGAAVMWVDGARSFGDFGGVPKYPPAQAAEWSRQLVRAKMFHNLIGNPDPNLGNWLVDTAWNVILIDHSRAFQTNTKLTFKLERVHKELWDRMALLSAEEITASPVGRWLDPTEVRSMLERRDKMRKVVETLVRTKHAAAYVP